MPRLRIADPTNAAPELFEHFGDLTPAPVGEADVEIWTAYANDWRSHSHVATILIDREYHLHRLPDAHCTNLAHRPRAVYARNARHPEHDTGVPAFEFWHWFVTTMRCNPDLQQLASGSKPWLAAVLMGGWERGRARLLQGLRDLDLEKQCLVRLSPKWNQHHRDLRDVDVQYYVSPELGDLDIPGFAHRCTEPAGFNTMQPLPDRDVWSWYSALIPWNILDRTWLSVVTETENIQDFDRAFFPTEKTAKVMLAGHPFLILGGQYFLRNLRDLGFRTFDPWLDETYDTVQDREQRIQALLRSLRAFSSLPESRRLAWQQAVSDICEHNRARAQDMKTMLEPLHQGIHNTYARFTAIPCDS